MFWRHLIIFCAIFLINQAKAANYYFAANGNDSYTSVQAKNKATPWQTIGKLNSYFTNILPGDSILFRCGDTFSGTISITKSGTAANPIIIGSYGTGNKPVFSGLAPTSGWINLGGGIFQGNCPLAAPMVNIVVSNGISQPLGRYPNFDATNSGYLNIDSHLAGTQITSSALNTAINWAGAEVVIRKNHWTIDRGIISSNTATVINYTGASSYQPLNNFGFFIQNHPATLDEVGEWYYNPASKKVNLFFGASMPGGVNVQVGSLDSIINITNKSYIVISGLAFNGANNFAIQLLNANYVTIKNCNITQSGINGINASNATYLTIQNDTISGSNNSAILLNGAHNTISNNTIYNNGLLPGMGARPNPSYSAVYISGVANTVANNDIENAGYDGICHSGDSVLIKNNFVTNFTQIEDDGGGIYAWGGKDTTVLNHGRQVLGNIVLNGNAATNGTSGTFLGCSVGIYTDDNSSGMTISGNTVSGCPGGAKLHNSQSITFTGNTLFNNLAQLIVPHDNPLYTTKNLSISGNIAFSEYITQPTLAISSFKADIPNFGTFSNNYYSNVIDNTFQFSIANKALNLSMWQGLYNKDITSSLAMSIPYYLVNSIDKRNKFPNGAFNANTNGALTYSANGNFKGAWMAKLDAGTFEGYFSFISGSPSNGESVTIPIGAVNTGNTYMLKFSMIGTKTNERVIAYLINSAAPYNIVSEKQYTMLDIVRGENTFYFNPTTSLPSATVVFALENEDATIWLDNVGLYQTSATVNNPVNNIIFAYNNTTVPKLIKLGKNYVDVKNNKYSGSTTLAPFTSIILIKNADSLAVMPPVIYSAPNASKGLTDAVSSTQQVSVSVYPNPATDYIMFNFNKSTTQNLNIDLINTNGETVFSQKVQVTNNSYRLDFSSKPRPGCYFIHLSGDGVNQTSKVIIM